MLDREDGPQLGLIVLRRVRDDPVLFTMRRIADDDREHEAIELGFRQRVCTFLFEWVLRRQHEERVG